jgi:hypothetical protein
LNYFRILGVIMPKPSVRETMKMNRRGMFKGLLALSVPTLSSPALTHAGTNFKPIPTQFLAAIGNPLANHGTGAENWGLWTVDPGPRGVRLSAFEQLKASGNVAPAGWTFDPANWWLEEHGLIMEQPAPNVPAGRYMVTGDRIVQTVLTIFPKDAKGAQAWELGDKVVLYDVTHLRCRAARYTLSAGSKACTPGMVDPNRFPMSPGDAMPLISGCDAQDHAVLFIVGVEE